MAVLSTIKNKAPRPPLSPLRLAPLTPSLLAPPSALSPLSARNPLSPRSPLSPFPPLPTPRFYLRSPTHAYHALNSTTNPYVPSPAELALIESFQKQLPHLRPAPERIQEKIISMAHQPYRPTISTSMNSILSPVDEDATPASATVASPARGKETVQFLQSRMRSMPFVHAWDFYYEPPPPDSKNGRSSKSPSTSPSESTPATNALTNATAATNTDSATQYGPSAADYNPDLKHLLSTEDIKSFWEFMNNFDVETILKRKASLHLFHRTILPVWEHPRNIKGGAWHFRVSKEHAADFWTQICVAAVGEQLQKAVETNRTTFRDDICGVSFSWRWNNALVQVWNRDGNHTEAIAKILEVVKEAVDEEIMAKEFYYKKHSDHEGFTGPKN